MYWLFALLAGLLLTTWWYRRRAEASGLETSTKAYARVTLAGLLVVLGMSLVRAAAAEGRGAPAREMAALRALLERHER
ncbi:hypothetical protein [Actinosynnema mirum]|uniref:Uncharacterized protein n=1 Tax=Actinosynnema mirum (strain ATCC 29888 / DSM 43827 / JCM 3225 / NBRC 14064 / NCIMB 13271 / NRRL B-12336 / IMRU 3971 / 101) TaxID=446462 RepID=C6WH83_ACTMD|nr:hypothetical protein [Actinosynnema mirum]ACU38002.1 hypothetical protein Amir_4147 [Actinosynnema mirum DSM 43827]